MLLYPFVGPDSNFKADTERAWNGDDFWLVPVRVRRQSNLAAIIPALAQPS
jgi:hypothetical protein